MIRHIVMWHVAGDSAARRAAVREQFRDAFEGLRGNIPGLLHIEVGFDIGVADGACDVVLVTEFVDRAALELYLADPEHLRVRDELQGLRVGRHQIDYIVE